MVVFTVSGLWHGANWTFIVWGALNGIFYMMETLARKQFPSVHLPKWLQVAITFNLICITWVFFRANSVTDGMFVLAQIGKVLIGVTESLRNSVPRGIFLPTLYGLVGVLILIYVNLLERKALLQQRLAWQRSALKWAVYYFLGYGTLVLGNLSNKQFIYFQF